LTDVKPEEVESDLARLRVEGMGDTGFLKVEFQPHLLEPLFS
jgi:hypothetical protein